MTAEVSGNSLADNGLETSAGVSIICQNDCATSGDDSVHDAGPGGEIEPLTINLAELAVDTLAPAP